MSGDKETLMSMGFDEQRVQAALKATNSSGLQPALDWLVAHENEPLPSSSTADKDDDDDDDMPDHLKQVSAEAKSLKCLQCGKTFRTTAQASWHGDKSGHDQFEESTEEIKPLTEEEKAAKLAELRDKAAERKKLKAKQEAEEAKANEAIRRKAGKDTAQLKAEIQAREAEKQAEQRRRDKLEDAKARAAVKAQIEADKKARAEKAAKEKALREGRPLPATSEEPAQKKQALASTASSSSSVNHDQARLQLRLPAGQPLVHTVPSSTTLAEVQQYVQQQSGLASVTFSTTFPRKVFATSDLGKTVAELGLTPSAVLVVTH